MNKCLTAIIALGNCIGSYAIAPFNMGQSQGIWVSYLLETIMPFAKIQRNKVSQVLLLCMYMYTNIEKQTLPSENYTEYHISSLGF